MKFGVDVEVLAKGAVEELARTAVVGTGKDKELAGYDNEVWLLAAVVMLDDATEELSELTKVVISGALVATMVVTP